MTAPIYQHELPLTAILEMLETILTTTGSLSGKPKIYARIAGNKVVKKEKQFSPMTTVHYNKGLLKKIKVKSLSMNIKIIPLCV